MLLHGDKLWGKNKARKGMKNVGVIYFKIQFKIQWLGESLLRRKHLGKISEDKRASQVHISRKNIFVTKTNRCKGPELREFLVYLRNSNKTNMSTMT